MRIRPLNDRVVLQRADETKKTAAGIYIPEKARDVSMEATVIAVGPGKVSKDGRRIEPTVKVGDKVLVQQRGGVEIERIGDTYEKLLIVREDEILAVL